MNPPLESRKRQTLTAIALIVGGYFCYSVADLCSKILQQTYTVYQILAISGVIGLVICSVWLAARYGFKSFVPSRLPLHLFRALCVTGTSFFMVSALKTLPLADFYGIAFIVPLLVKLLAVFLLKEKIGWRRWAASLVGFCGILLVAGPQFDHIGAGVVYCLLGAVCASLNIISLRRIGQSEPLPLYGFYPFLFISILNVAALIATDTYVPLKPETYGYLALHGPIVVAGLIWISLGFGKAPETAVVAPFLYTQILWGIGFGWFFFHALPGPATWAGLSLVIGAGLYSLWREYRTKHPD